MLAEENYKDLSRVVYLIDEKHTNYNPTIKEGATVKSRGSYYKILKVEDNTTNGMQAMAVAPVHNGKVDVHCFCRIKLQILN